MDIKKLLEQLGKGEITHEQFAETVENHTKNMVPRDRLNEKIAEVKRLEGEVETRDDQLEEVGKKAKGNEELENTLKQLKQENQQSKEQYEKEIAGLKFNAALDQTLLTAKARNSTAVKALLDMDTIKLNDDGSLMGLSEQLEKIQASDAYLFDLDGGQSGNTGSTGTTYVAGSSQKGNTPPPPPNAYDRGAERARKMFSKEEN
jgi:hypothetical protein